MNHLTELPFVDEFRWVSPLSFVKNERQNAVPLWCMLQVGPPSLHYCCAVVLRSSIVLPPVGHSSNHEYHCCQLTGQSIGVSNFYDTFKVFVWLTFVCVCVCVCVCAYIYIRRKMCSAFFKDIKYRQICTLHLRHHNIMFVDCRCKQFYSLNSWMCIVKFIMMYL